jgi:hypothetical protein
LAALGEPADPVISQRRGNVVAAALAGTVLLVVGYGSGIGLVPATSGDLAAGPDPGPVTPPSSAELQQVPPTIDLTDPGQRTRTPTLDLPSIRLPGPTTVYPWLPDRRGGPTDTPPTTGSPSPSITTPTTRPPTTTPPPAGCSGLVDGLLGGLTTYLGGANLDVTLLRQVSAVLGLDRYLASGKPLTEQLVAPLTPVLDVVPSVLDSLGLGLGLGLGGGAAADDAQLVDGLRTLLDVGGVVSTVTTVTGLALRGLLDGVVGGC